MSKYEFKAINLIAETFEQRDVKFDVVYPNGSEQILAGFFVDCGPCVIMRFISRDNDNDVAARIFGLISNIPKEKEIPCFGSLQYAQSQVPLHGIPP